MSKKQQTTRPSKRGTIVELAKGQVWRVQDCHIEIVELGKNLARYRRLINPKHKGVPTRMTTIRAIEDYLTNHRAILLQNEKSN